jgi:hypothetical protein
MAQRDLKPGKDLDTFGNSMLGKLSRTSKANIQRPVNKRRRQQARKRIAEEREQPEDRAFFVRAMLPLMLEVGIDGKWAGPLADCILRARDRGGA